MADEWCIDPIVAELVVCALLALIWAPLVYVQLSHAHISVSSLIFSRFLWLCSSFPIPTSLSYHWII